RTTQPAPQEATPGAIPSSVASERIETCEGFVDDRSGVRSFGDIIDRATRGTYARQQRSRTFQYLNPLEISRVHWAARHGRGADPDVVVKRVDLVAGEAAHREY